MGDAKDNSGGVLPSRQQQLGLQLLVVGGPRSVPGNKVAVVGVEPFKDVHGSLKSAQGVGASVSRQYAGHSDHIGSGWLWPRRQEPEWQPGGTGVPLGVFHHRAMHGLPDASSNGIDAGPMAAADHSVRGSVLTPSQGMRSAFDNTRAA